jgi:5-formyltetrahydrofolate cyclo-ligase
VRTGDRLLAFHAVTLDALAPSRFGLREPSADATRVEVTEIAAFVVPGLAFDRSGGRIGWGRGHYDATFAAASPDALRVGLAYECQLIEQVEREPHDVALHIIITEVATHRVARVAGVAGIG